MGQFCELGLAQWAAILVSDEAKSQQVLGLAVDEDRIPSSLRRRMGRLERLAVRCALGVLEDSPSPELILCSRFGNLETLATLLRGLAEEQLMSPLAFAGSVHNASPGLIGQIRHERIPHTAIAAGVHTFAAGLIESYARLICDECRDVTLVFADLALPDPFATFEDEDAPGLAMAVRLERVVERPLHNPTPISAGRRGVVEVVERLKGGPAVLSVGEGMICWVS